MRKLRGFTLIELLIALGIVALISAILAPSLNNIIPDKYKSKVLKNYNMISKVTENMLNNSDIYFDSNGTYNNGFVTPSCTGLECTGQPKHPQYNDSRYSGDAKYPNLLVTMLNLPALDNTGTTYADDGTIWHIVKSGNDYNITLIYGYNRSEAENAVANTYSEENKKPNAFIFKVDRDGVVRAGDAMTYAYLQNATKNDKKLDVEEADRNLGNFVEAEAEGD